MSTIKNPFERVCLYYGWPICLGHSWDINTVAALYCKYDIIVLGDEYEHPTHEAYEEYTQPLCAKIKELKPTIKFFGYINIGVSNENLPIATIQQYAQEWKTLGATGIFLDCFGYDYEVTRARQNEIVTYCHNQNLNVIANAWNLEDVFSSDVDADWNPSGTAPVINSNDYMLLEGYFYSLTGDNLSQQLYKTVRPYRIEKQYEYLNTIHTGESATWKSMYGTKMMALDGIPGEWYSEEDDEYYRTLSEKEYNRLVTVSLIGAAILKIDSIAIGNDHWGSSGSFVNWTWPEDLDLYPLDSEMFTMHYSNDANDSFVNKVTATINNNLYALNLNYSTATDYNYEQNKMYVTKNGTRLLNAWDSNDFIGLQVDVKYGDTKITSLTDKSLVMLDTDNKLLTDEILVEVVSTNPDTSDATASAADIVINKTAYIADGSKATGTISIYNGEEVPDAVVGLYDESWYTDAENLYILDQILPHSLIKIPNILYDGTEKTVVVNGYIDDLMEISGTTTATDIGIYTLTITLKNNYIFDDTKTAVHDYTWRIAELGTYTLCYNNGEVRYTYNFEVGMTWADVLEVESYRLPIDSSDDAYIIDPWGDGYVGVYNGNSNLGYRIYTDTNFTTDIPIAGSSPINGAKYYAWSLD